ncbi:MAG: HNH endonuclease signature motif containing protein [Candidatus Paceibacterota bacterium]
MSLPLTLEIDHIDGNPENNEKENLRLLCPNCHSQTSTYRGKNAGRISNSKRSVIRKKYVGLYR